MPRSRDLWIILRARDEASRVFRGFAANMAGQQQLISRTVASMSKQYDDMGRTVGGTFRQMSQNGKISSEVISKLDKDGNQLNTVMKETVRQGNQVTNFFREYNKNGQLVSKSSERATDNFKKMRMTADEAASRVDALGRVALLAGTSLVVMGGAGLAFISSAVEVAAEYDRQSRRTLTQIDDVSASLEEVAEVGRRVARDIGVPFETLQDTLFFVFSSMDVSIQESEILLRGFAKEAVAGQTDIESAARTTIAIMNALQIPVEELTDLQDMQFQVVRKGIISYEELSKTIGRALPAASRAGQGFKTLGAMIAFMTRNGLSAAMASTSAARALESFAHPKVVKRLEDMGIAVRDQAGEYLPLLDVMRQVNDSMSDMAQPERTALLQDLFLGAGGTRQARRFWDLAFKNFDQFEDMVGHMGNASGAFGDAYNNMAGSVAVQSELLRNKWMLIKESIGSALLPMLVQLIGIVQVVLSWFDNLPQSVKTIVAQFIFWGSVIMVVLGALLIFVGMLGFFIAGIIVAGKVLIIVLGAFILIAAAVLGFVAAIVAAWFASEQFREIVSTIIDFLKELWGIAVETASGLKDAFEENLLPPLQRLWQVIEGDILPVVNDFLSQLKDELLPVIEELGKFLVEKGGEAFKFIGDAIDNHLIPALEKAKEFYEENREEVDTLIGWITTAAKVIGTVFVGAIVGAITGIGVIIIVIAKLIEFFLKLVGWIFAVGAFFNDLRETLLQWGTNVINFFIMVWNSIVSVFQSAWEFIKMIVGAGIAFVSMILQSVLNFILTTLWQPFWNTFGGILTSAWELILALIEFFTVLFSEIWKDWLVPLGQFFVDVWNNIVEFLKSAWTRIKDGISVATAFIGKLWHNVWTGVRDFFVSIWNSIVGAVRKAMNWINNKIIRPVVRSIKNFWDDHLSGMWNKAKEIFNKIVNWISDKIDTIKGFFKNAKDWLIQAGKDIIQGLLNGIESMIDNVTSRLQELTDMIPDLKGPRTKDLKLLRQSGVFIMSGFMKGIESQIPMVMSQLRGITAEVGGFHPVIGGVGFEEDRFGPSEPRVGNTQNITIHTNEIDPIIHSQKLGFLLQQKMG